ncbi:cyclase family protein [Acuticoccus sp. I52.16.1]|uniref:cyclase family protein n=1 Tax=Acuticoccus sp. I52.16.1 TaxID=2928472 RepID=UPI001FD22DFD|nr:cyclase family protein [Acuticoccus sp. I52.16.1]UOM33955.1 cyclase family protein [Acuticoccus sp. I52.16.1]
MKIYDLSMPIDEGHLRWPVERLKKGDFAAGDLFEVSGIRTTCHGFTHVDAPRHMVPGGDTLDALDLSRVCGPAAVIDLTDIQPNEEVTAARLAERAGHLERGQIAMFRSCWDEQRDWNDASFWRDAPYMSREASQWLLERGPTAVAFDFPQDYTIRLMLDGEMRPIPEHVTHDVLLRNKVTLIEYLVNTRQVTTPTTFLSALPIRYAGSDGAPARVVAIDMG